jgi:hypothetical protein
MSINVTLKTGRFKVNLTDHKSASLLIPIQKQKTPPSVASTRRGNVGEREVKRLFPVLDYTANIENLSSKRRILCE